MIYHYPNHERSLPPFLPPPFLFPISKDCCWLIPLGDTSYLNPAFGQFRAGDPLPNDQADLRRNTAYDLGYGPANLTTTLFSLKNFL